MTFCQVRPTGNFKLQRHPTNKLVKSLQTSSISIPALHCQKVTTHARLLITTYLALSALSSPMELNLAFHKKDNHISSWPFSINSVCLSYRLIASIPKHLTRAHRFGPDLSRSAVDWSWLFALRRYDFWRVDCCVGFALGRTSVVWNPLLCEKLGRSLPTLSVNGNAYVRAWNLNCTLKNILWACTWRSRNI